VRSFEIHGGRNTNAQHPTRGRQRH
jgi:hypothetical protein